MAYTVTQLSRLAGVSPRTIRYYTRSGCFRPGASVHRAIGSMGPNRWIGCIRSCFTANWALRFWIFAPSWTIPRLIKHRH